MQCRDYKILFFLINLSLIIRMEGDRNVEIQIVNCKVFKGKVTNIYK